ncbi:hypothetical protein [Caulobacter sp. LjRoot300]|uniref:hypothetical protein n=1 Tax=Caulobacter sp. LjRoot300 TaxID=3342321 RepID=UPI003ECFFB40
MPFAQVQMNDYAVVIHAGNDAWTWQVMDFEARVAASGEAPDRESAWRGSAAGSEPGQELGDRQKKGRLPQERRRPKVA